METGMVRMPKAPNGWFDADFAGREGASDIDPGFSGRLDDQKTAGPAQGSIFDGLPGMSDSSSLNWLMAPEAILAIPELPQHVYDRAMKDRQSDPIANGGEEHASSLDQASLAPSVSNSSGSDHSGVPTVPAQRPGERYEQGSKATGYLEKAIDLWNGQNRILGLHFGQEAPEMLEKYTGPIAKGLIPLENGLAAASEIQNGAPALPTVAGASIRTGSTLGAMALGAMGGAELGTLLGGPAGAPVGGAIGGFVGGIAPDWVYGNASNGQLGEAAGRIAADTGHAYDRYVIRNPYFDPRLAIP